jgi:hypothetical protein
MQDVGFHMRDRKDLFHSLPPKQSRQQSFSDNKARLKQLKDAWVRVQNKLESGRHNTAVPALAMPGAGSPNVNDP